jgi:hypothetical protein
VAKRCATSQVKLILGSALVDANMQLFEEANALAAILADVRVCVEASSRRRSLLKQPQRSLVTPHSTLLGPHLLQLARPRAGGRRDQAVDRPPQDSVAGIAVRQ